MSYSRQYYNPFAFRKLEYSCKTSLINNFSELENMFIISLEAAIIWDCSSANPLFAISFCSPIDFICTLDISFVSFKISTKSFDQKL